MDSIGEAIDAIDAVGCDIVELSRAELLAKDGALASGLVDKQKRADFDGREHKLDRRLGNSNTGTPGNVAELTTQEIGTSIDGSSEGLGDRSGE